MSSLRILSIHCDLRFVSTELPWTRWRESAKTSYPSVDTTSQPSCFHSGQVRPFRRVDTIHLDRNDNALEADSSLARWLTTTLGQNDFALALFESFPCER